MIGVTEIAIIAIVGAIIFFGKGQVLDWAKTLGNVKKSYNGELDATTEVKQAIEPEVVETMGVS